MKQVVIIAILILSLLFTSCTLNDPIDEMYVENLTVTEEFSLTNYVWEDFRVPVNLVQVPSEKAPSWGVYSSTLALYFANQAVVGNEEEVYFIVQLPHGYAEGTDISPHVHYAFESDEVGTQIRWGLSYSWVNVDGEFPASNTIYALTSEANNDSGTHRVASFDMIDGTGKEISSLLLCRLFRNSSDALDTYVNDGVFLDFDIHYQVSGLGSDEEFMK